MKQKVLALAGCIAATAPSVSIADVLPEKLVGLNLGEIRSSSFLNQPFKGIIPFLFTSHENSKNLSIKLAPKSVFNQIGAEKHPVLNNLNFQVTQQNNKPVILISSDKPINLPFLNFILEIKGPGTLVYQDYTVLLDPESKQQATASNVEYIDVKKENFQNTESNELYKSYKDLLSKSNTNTYTNKQTLKESGTLLLANLSSKTQSSNKQNLKYKVKSGDSLSKIAQRSKLKNASLKTVSKLIYQKNPKAFIRGNVNRLKKGAILHLPTNAEINGFEIAKTKQVKKEASKLDIKLAKETKKTIVKANKENQELIKKKTTNTYTVLKGDSLSKITKKFTAKDVSFTKMMNTIYNNNPTAFINQSKNKLKAGAKLEIPTLTEKNVEPNLKIVKTETSNTKEINTKSKVADSEKSLANNISVSKSANKNTNDKLIEEINLKPNQYQIKEGDTLSYVTNKIGYKEVPFAEMLKAIYVNNPDAFIDGKIVNLSVGSVITLPSLATLRKKLTKTPKVIANTPSSKIQKYENTKPIITNDNKVVSTDLTKRIRELRKELSQAKDSLSDLKNNLSNKETLLEQKNIQLKSLNTMLTKYDKNIDSSSLAAVAIKTNANKPIVELSYKPKSKAEMAKLKRDLLNRSDKTQKQIAKIKDLKNKTSEPIKSLNAEENKGLFKDYKVSSMLNITTNTNYAYLSMALLLGLLLIRYRRVLYSYTYSKIKYDQPTYYPIPDVDKFDLKEKNINFSDPKMDEETSSENEALNNDKYESSVLINPHLVEATEEIFETNEEAKQIAHCEHLVTELFDDADDSVKNAEWEDIEKVCDTYIEKIKDNEISSVADMDGAIIEEATDFNNMMTDLLESLDKVDKSVKRNNILDENFPDIVNAPELKTIDNHTNN